MGVPQETLRASVCAWSPLEGPKQNPQKNLLHWAG